MFKKLLLAVATLVATMGFAFAQVDVNKADQAALDGVKGIGPKTSKVIIDERTKGGAFKDWADFEKRVKGIGKKNAVKLSQGGLTVNGQANPDAAGAPMASGKASTPAAPAAMDKPAKDKMSKKDKAEDKAAAPAPK